MDDGFAPDKINPFDQYDPDKTPVGIPAPETTQDNQPAPQANPFDDLGDVIPEPVSTTGAHAVRSSTLFTASMRHKTGCSRNCLTVSWMRSDWMSARSGWTSNSIP